MGIVMGNQMQMGIILTWEVDDDCGSSDVVGSLQIGN